MPRKKAATAKNYTLAVKLGDKVLEGTGATALEALENLETPIKIMTKGVVSLTDGVKKVEQTWSPAKLKRLFYPVARFYYSRRLEYLMR